MRFRSYFASFVAIAATIGAWCAAFLAGVLGSEERPATRRRNVIESKPHPGPVRIGGLWYAQTRHGWLTAPSGASPDAPTADEPVTVEELMGMFDKRFGPRLDAIDKLLAEPASRYQQDQPDPTAVAVKDDKLTSALNQFLSVHEPKADEALLVNLTQKADGAWGIEDVDTEAIVEAEMGRSMAHAGYLVGIENSINKSSHGVIKNFEAGSILIGGSVGLLLGELVDGFQAPGNSGNIAWGNVALKAGAIWATNQWGGVLMSRQGQSATMVILGVQILADVLPLDGWIASAVSKIRGYLPSAGLGRANGADHALGYQDRNALNQHRSSVFAGEY